MILLDLDVLARLMIIVRDGSFLHAIEMRLGSSWRLLVLDAGLGGHSFAGDVFPPCPYVMSMIRLQMVFLYALVM